MQKSTSVPPEPKIESHWKKFSLPIQIGSGRNFTPGESGMRLAFYRSSVDHSLVGRIWFGEGIEGPPKHVHGGVSTYVLDEALGSASWLSGYATVAANLNVDFLEMTPIGVDLLVEAHVIKVEGRNVTVHAQIKDDSGIIYSRAVGRFHRLPKKKLEKIFASIGLSVEDWNLKFIEDGHA